MPRRRRWWSSRARPNRAPGCSCRACGTNSRAAAFAATRLLQGVAPGREVRPSARPPRSWGSVLPPTRRLGRDRPSLVIRLGIALAHEEYNGGGVRRAVVRQQRLPVLRQQVGFLRDGIDIVRQRERDDIGVEAVDDGPGLFSRAAVRLLMVTVSPVLSFQYAANALL